MTYSSLPPAAGRYTKHSRVRLLRLHELSFAEVHDCFTIAELICYEMLDLAPRGQGRRGSKRAGRIRDGRLPVNLCPAG